MASRKSNIVTIDLRSGPTLRAALDVLDLAAELAELVPDWHAAQRDELIARTETLRRVAIDNLRSSTGG